ncbi:restriction endonuclease subunit S [Veillonella sp.]|uniref:restriction endonuclease subunit S n=1 Tax=Veillonella sp. TaxID=1926307 RepID=UPI00290ADAAA|nr:restriction endonuclease subunit S [Veillonella sp.]MDU4009595.1 restriction endonuclease subunit S [Veillonella sp.]
MSKEKRRVPKLRFPGFTEDWEQRKLGDVIDSLYNGQTPSRFDKANWEGDIPWLTSGELNRGVVNHSIEKITQQGRDDANLKIVPKGTVVIAITGLEAAGTRGNCAKLGFDTTLNQSCMAIYPKSEFLDPDFLFQWYIAVGEEYGIKYTQGTKQQSYNAELIKILPISVPRVTEQRKITRILDSFDDIITLHQRKLEHLNLKKKALLQKLFPKNGARYPELRFPGFTDAWEQRKFSEITYLSGIKNKENKPYESYSISNEFGFIPQNEQFEHGGTMKTADKSMYYIVTQNSFAYNPARINVGSIGYYDKPDNVIVSSLYEVFKTTEIVNDKFLWHWFKSNQFNHLIEKYQEGGVRLYFYYDKLCKGAIELPTIDEQNKISNLLNGLDLFITLHQRKLEHLQLQKKALLQQMFV